MTIKSPEQQLIDGGLPLMARAIVDQARFGRQRSAIELQSWLDWLGSSERAWRAEQAQSAPQPKRYTAPDLLPPVGSRVRVVEELWQYTNQRFVARVFEVIADDARIGMGPVIKGTQVRNNKDRNTYLVADGGHIAYTSSVELVEEAAEEPAQPPQADSKGHAAYSAVMTGVAEWRLEFNRLQHAVNTVAGALMRPSLRPEGLTAAVTELVAERDAALALVESMRGEATSKEWVPVATSLPNCGDSIWMAIRYGSGAASVPGERLNDWLEEVGGDRRFFPIEWLTHWMPRHVEQPPALPGAGEKA